MNRAHLTLDPQFTIGPVNRRLFGSFVEHLGRCVYDGIYEPGHEKADEEGFRTDVIELVRELGVSTIRYPGGNFVSGYRWEDGVGPRDERPPRLDLAWHSTESNEIGLDEFAGWLKKVDSELMYAVNLGTRGVLEALDVLEYANLRSGTHWAQRRVANGHPEPHGIRMWCLGNEMDGPWQLGHSTAEEYGRLAAKTASAMRQIDPDLELVVCGSSSAQMPTFGDWERVVLEHTYDDVDFISCHAYYEPKGDDYGSFLASGVNMDRFIEAVVATADHVKATRRSDKTINISFDEWNVWYQSRYNEVDKITDVAEWPVAPRLLEDSYSVLDAVVLGSLMISLIRHADRVTAASLAQLVNVIAPIMTEPGGPAWRQTTFHPFSLTSRLARDVALELKLDSPTYGTRLYGEVPLVDAVATYDEAGGGTTVFAVNRSLTEEVTLDIDTRAVGSVGAARATSLFDGDIHAANTLEDPERVSPRENTSVSVGEGTVSITLPPVSWTVLTLD
ncbi:alpha-N-arabinofuranosidase [Microbacterium sp. QXD-8]|uniref:non-reducing end alpha-L-arabinofuranosidase n=1 Tax=Microbacterium psychrotolerans TaxID=3068321 RepID=A0ABU0Z5U1_9MICO|nr:alpha-N-arabinofuranosidase [Microbacterium sp. QXD-8]MDQ7879221.1 alpha-N-arabinofuranosidase [Microbacterium sp. QXD-8]